MKRASVLIAGLSVCVAVLPVCVPVAAEEPEYEMAEFQLVLMMRGDQPYPKREDRSAMQAGHRAFLETLVEEGKALAAGTVVDKALRVALVLDVGSVAAAEELMAQDPWVRGGQLEAKVHSWWAAKGILQKPSSFHEPSAATLGLLKRPADAPEFSDEKLAELQAGHMANMEKMAADGHLVIAGPMGADGVLRGILVFRLGDMARVESMVAEDPSVAANRLEVELYRWVLPKGTLPAAE